MRSPARSIATAAVLFSIIQCGGGGGPAGPPPDTTPPPPPRIDLITATFPATGISSIDGGAGSVEAGAAVTIRNINASRQGPPVEALASAGASGAFTTAIQATFGDTLQIVAADAAGNESTESLLPVPGADLGRIDLFRFPNGSGTLTLPFADVTQEYTLVVQTLRIGSQELATRLTGSGSTALSVRRLGAARAGTGEHGLEGVIRAIEREALPALGRVQRSVSRRAIVPAVDVGDQRQFNVLNTTGGVNISDPSVFDQVTATARFVGDNTVVWVDDAAPAVNVPETLIQQIGTQFDTQTFPTNTSAFGANSDVDGDGRVSILLTPVVNNLTPQDEFDEGGGFISGFFFGIDLLPDPLLNPFANGGEVFYAVIPDPDSAFGPATIPIAAAGGLLDAVFAHEHVHMISARFHVLETLFPRLEELWLDEALAHEAESLNGFDVQNRLRSGLFLEDPGSVTLTGGGDALDERGAAWLFIHYLVDHEARLGGAGLLSRLIQTSQVGVPNVQTATGSSLSQLFHEWSTTLLVDGVAGLPFDPIFDLPSVALRPDYQQTLVDGLVSGPYLGPQNQPVGVGQVTITQLSTSPVYIAYTATAPGPGTIQVDGDPGAVLQVTVVRTR